MRFVWIWEQTEIISLYSINWLVFINETECVYCAVRTGSLYTASSTFSNSTFCPHNVFMCFVWIWEQTAIISLYSINWLAFITDTECVYCAVRTGSLYTASLTFSNSTFCPHSAFMCFVWIWEQTAIISLYSINRLVFTTETDCVYCAARAGSLNINNVNLALYGVDRVFPVMDTLWGVCEMGTIFCVLFAQILRLWKRYITPSMGNMKRYIYTRNYQLPSVQSTTSRWGFILRSLHTQRAAMSKLFN
jgi:hypothetical protein